MIPKVKYYGPQIPSTYAVNMTAAASGSNGITVADDDDIDFGTGDFFIHWEGSLPDWTPGTSQRVIRKYDAAAAGFVLNVNTNGTLAFSLFAGSGLLSYDSTISTGLTDSAAAKITVSVVRSTASAAGSVTFYVNGTQLGSAIAISASASISASTATALAVCGGDGTTGTQRTASNTISCIVGNFAPTSAEVLDLCTNGIPENWKWGSQANAFTGDSANFEGGTVGGWSANGGAGATSVAVNTVSPISGTYDLKIITNGTSNSGGVINLGTVTAGKRYRIKFDFKNATGSFSVRGRTSSSPASGSTWANFAAIPSGDGTYTAELDCILSTTAARLHIFIGAVVNSIQLDNFEFLTLGITMAFLPETIPTSGALAWTDSSGNTGGGTLPAAGATKVTIRK